MNLLDTITVAHPTAPSTLELYHGDLSRLPPQHAVDVLVVSAFPGSYRYARGSLVRSLGEAGMDVGTLYAQRAVDLRADFGCWLSAPIPQEAGYGFRYVLGFEPLHRGKPTEVVGDVFRALIPFVTGEPFVRSVAMPLVATGRDKITVADMLIPMVTAAVRWLALGLPVTTLKLVESAEHKAIEIKGGFAVLKRTLDLDALLNTRAYAYDLFISYSRKDQQHAETLLAALHAARPGLRVFIDRQEIAVGAAWQQQLYEALDDSARVVALLSPDYLASRVCKEEYNIAHLRHRDQDGGVLVPLLIRDTPLPSYMRLVNFIDCREADDARLRAAAATIANGG